MTPRSGDLGFAIQSMIGETRERSRGAERTLGRISCQRDPIGGDMAETIGVLGAGALGTLLATRLHRAGHTVHVYARDPARREVLSQEGSAPHIEDHPEGL